MHIPLLPRWNLRPNRPSFYDTDSATLLELASKMHAAFNEMVTDYNKFAESVNSQMQEFMESTNADQEAFQVGIRQEFQDFINTVDLKLYSMENTLSTINENVQAATEVAVREAIASGTIAVETEYDPKTETLNFIVSGGV